jgi:hypothetical protein
MVKPDDAAQEIAFAQAKNLARAFKKWRQPQALRCTPGVT